MPIEEPEDYYIARWTHSVVVHSGELFEAYEAAREAGEPAFLSDYTAYEDECPQSVDVTLKFSYTRSGVRHVVSTTETSGKHDYDKEEALEEDVTAIEAACIGKIQTALRGHVDEAVFDTAIEDADEERWVHRNDED